MVLRKDCLGGRFCNGVGKETDGGRKTGEKLLQELKMGSPQGDEGGGNEDKNSRGFMKAELKSDGTWIWRQKNSSGLVVSDRRW